MQLFSVEKAAECWSVEFEMQAVTITRPDEFREITRSRVIACEIT